MNNSGKELSLSGGKKRPFKFFKKTYSADVELKNLKNKPASYFEKKGEEMVLRVFDFVYNNVPAYKEFLKSLKIEGKNIKNIEDYKKLPVMDKNTYIRKYPFLDLIPNRDISQATIISATSGSTGEPFCFPRGAEQDAQYEYIAELFLKNSFEIDNKKTLGIIGFGLGIWIGGIFTYKVLNKISEKGYDLTLMTIGPSIEMYLNALKKMGHNFDQVLIMGYPPFIKDVIDEAKDYGIDWKNYNIKILTAAEGYSEKFRDYISEKAFLKNPLKDTVNIYGTVEMGTMAHETPITNLIRKIALEKKDIFRAIFPKANKIPTLAQYYPEIIHFEEVNGEVIASGYGSSIPLLRYRFPDMGGVIKFDEMISKLKVAGIDILSEAKKHGIENTILHLPFVYVYDRTDHAIILRGANIFAEEIKNALHNDKLHSLITGKFTMIKCEDKKMNNYFEIHVELRKKNQANKKISKMIQEIVVNYLLKINSEFQDQYKSVPKIMTPKIILWPYQHEKHFKPGGKQKWVKK